MTLGEKIRKYRQLKGLTQKELGEKIGFSSATADSRIRKYESNLMAPKDDIRGRLMEVLDVDASALSDVNIQSAEDIMQVLFLLEEICDMKIERTTEKTSLTFNNSNKDIALLISYLYAWHTQKQKLPNSDMDNAGEAQILYEKWKARFPRDLRGYWTNLEEEISKTYDPLIKNVTSSRTKITKLSEFLFLLRSMIQSGITIRVSTRTDNVSRYSRAGALVLSFRTADMLQTENNAVRDRFTEFLHDISVLESYGMHIATDMSIGEEGTTISYALYYPPMMGMQASINHIMSFEREKNKNDYSIGLFEEDFKHDVKLFDFRIVEDISSFSARE